MIDFSKFDNLISLTMYFNSEEKCRQAIIDSRWANGDIVCPYCGGHHCRERKDRRFRCRQCGRNFSCLVGTIFENTKVELLKWFVAMYLISSHKKGISSHQLARDIDVTQSTACTCCIRYACFTRRMTHEPLKGQLSAMRCISAERRNGSTSPCAHQRLRDAPPRPRHPCSG